MLYLCTYDHTGSTLTEHAVHNYILHYTHLSGAGATLLVFSVFSTPHLHITCSRLGAWPSLIWVLHHFSCAAITYKYWCSDDSVLQSYWEAHTLITTTLQHYPGSDTVSVTCNLSLSCIVGDTLRWPSLPSPADTMMINIVTDQATDSKLTGTNLQRIMGLRLTNCQERGSSGTLQRYLFYIIYKTLIDV